MCQELNNICIINFEKKNGFLYAFIQLAKILERKYIEEEKRLEEIESNKQKKIVKDVKNYKLNLLNKQNLMRKGL